MKKNISIPTACTIICRILYYALALSMAITYTLIFGLMRVSPSGVVGVWEHNPAIYSIELIWLAYVIVGTPIILYYDVIKVK